MFELSLRNAWCIHACRFLRTGSQKLYTEDDIEAFEKRAMSELTWQNRDMRLNVDHFFVAVRV